MEYVINTYSLRLSTIRGPVIKLCVQIAVGMVKRGMVTIFGQFFFLILPVKVLF